MSEVLRVLYRPFWQGFLTLLFKDIFHEHRVLTDVMGFSKESKSIISLSLALNCRDFLLGLENVDNVLMPVGQFCNTKIEIINPKL